MQENNCLETSSENSSHAEQQDAELIAGRVHQIRRQWAVHEDEALAYRLQNEEISQHYCGNRTRNAIVREDGPRAREEQDKEEKVALEERFHKLYLLQQQAEEDERLAKELAERYEMGLDAGSLLPASTSIPPSSSNSSFGLNNNSSQSKSNSFPYPPPDPELQLPPQQQNQNRNQSPFLKSEQRILNDISSVGSESYPYPSSSSSSKNINQVSTQSNANNSDLRKIHNSNLVKTSASSPSSSSGSGIEVDKKSTKTKSIIKSTSAYGDHLGAVGHSQDDGAMAVAGASGFSNSNGRMFCSSNSSSSSSSSPFNPDPDLDEDLPHLLHAHEERLLQEKLDQEVALKLQEELEKEENDKKLALEAQDRELAKILHQKEKERLRRAKERAKQKALLAAEGQDPNAHVTVHPSPDDLDARVHGAKGATIIGNFSARLSPSGDERTSRTPSRASAGSAGSSSELKSPSRVSNGSSNSQGHGQGHHPGPRIPEKTGLNMRDADTIGIIGFRAAPKALPPQPKDPHQNQHLPQRRPFVQGIGTGAGAGYNGSHAQNNFPSRYEDYRLPQDPIPPYMPLQGLQNYSKKKNK